eukprot:2590691-Alexandrium_andersonii.AAC.1
MQTLTLTLALTHMHMHTHTKPDASNGSSETWIHSSSFTARENGCVATNRFQHTASDFCPGVKVQAMPPSALRKARSQALSVAAPRSAACKPLEV